MNSASRKLTTFVCGLLAALLCLGGGTVITGVNAAESAFAYTSANGVSDYVEIGTETESKVEKSGVLNFVNIIGQNRPVMLMSKTELTAPYTIEISAYSNTGGTGNDGLFVLGSGECDNALALEDAGGLIISRSVGALALMDNIVQSGVKFYMADGETPAVGNFVMTATGYWTNADEMLWKFDVQENGHINVYYDLASAASPLTILRNIIKPEDGSDLEYAKKGFFAFVPNVSTGDPDMRTLTYVKENADKSTFEKIDEVKWELTGDKSKAVIAPVFGMVDANNSILVNKAYFTTAGLVNDKDVVFDITFMSSRTHQPTSPVWGLAFGMESMNDDVMSADRFELSVLNLRAYSGETALDSSNKGYASGVYNTGNNVYVRLVAHKDGTLDESRSVANTANLATLHGTYSGLDFNGYIAFYSRQTTDYQAGDGVQYNNISVSGNAVLADINTVVGASIRIKEPTGLRFETRINKAAYDALVETYGAENVKTGTIILPADYIDAEFKSGDAFDIEAYIAAKTADTDYKDVKNQLGFYNESTAAADGYYQYFGSLVNIRTENLDRDFFGIGYISITKGDATVTIYGGNSLTAHSRNISAVATLAVNDRSTTETEKYCNKIGENDYSPYTAEVLEMLNGFIVA